MKKKILLCGIVLVAGLSFCQQLKATCAPDGIVRANNMANPIPSPGVLARTLDVGRVVTNIVQSVIALCGDGEAKAQLIATQEENNQNASGEGGTTTTTNTSLGSLTENIGSAGDSEFSGSAFEYVDTVLLSKGGNVGYAPIKGVLGADRDAITSKIKQEFFATKGKSTDYQNKIRKKRSEYVQEAAGRHVSLGYQVKGYIQNDLSVISSVELTGDGELGAIAVDAHTLEQMVKIGLVDLALQIEMMEADAIQFLMHQPVTLMSETKK